MVVLLTAPVSVGAPGTGFELAPTVSTNRETSRGSARFFSATRIATGSVAEDELVPNAVHIASWIRRKNSRGDMRPTNFASAE